MFSRGIRSITIKDNITVTTVKPEESNALSSALRCLFSKGDPAILLCTSAGEILAAKEEDDAASELSVLDVSGVCMNDVGASISHVLEDAGVRVYATSLCDIAAAFIIDTKNTSKAIRAVRDNFTLEV